MSRLRTQGGCWGGLAGGCPGPHPGGRLGGLAGGGEGLGPDPGGMLGGLAGGVQACTGGGVQAQAWGCIPACTEADNPHPPADYASYWNAFLFLLLTSNSKSQT